MDTCLSPYRALDLTDEKGLLCGRVLADLGCDVIKVEKPGGDEARSIGPFYHDQPDREKSLYWMAYNTNKRGITLNIETADGRDLFGRLVKRSDFVIESFLPGTLEQIGLGYEALSRINPGLIMISISPFGQTGPYRRFKAPDIVSMAMGGSMYVCGDADRPPVRIGQCHAFPHGGAEGAAAGLMALYGREQTGVGQHVDVSIQECLIWTLMVVPQAWDLTRTNLGRAGSYRQLVSGVIRRNLWPCRDGHITFLLLGGQQGARTNRALVDLMNSRGYATELLLGMDWDSLDMVKATQEEVDAISEPIGRFFLAHTRMDLYEEALKRNIQLYPVTTAQDIVEDPQLRFRNFWAEVEYPQLETSLRVPGPFVRLSQTPVTRFGHAPRVGEHNEEIYIKELGLTPQDLVVLSEGGVI